MGGPRPRSEGRPPPCRLSASRFRPRGPAGLAYPPAPGVYRAAVVSLVLVLGAVAIGRASKSEAVPPRESLATFPMDIAEWRGQPAGRFDQQVLAVLGVDEYVNRVYTAPTNISVGLYIGYYESQREGDTMHSPLNCLPGAGWQPVKQERVTIPVATSLDEATGRPSGRREILVNRFVIRRGLDEQVVLYRYQSHGRVVASEDRGRSTPSLTRSASIGPTPRMVRVVCPVSSDDEAGEARAEQAATAFARAMFPLLGRYLPE